MADNDDVSFLTAGQNNFVRIQRKAGKRFDQLFADLCRLPPMKEGALRASVMKSYGLTSGEARYLLDMAREADAEAVVKDGEALRQEFTYRNHSHDLWQVLLGNLDRPFFAPLRPRGKEWPEDAVEAWYPELARHYSPENVL